MAGSKVNKKAVKIKDGHEPTLGVNPIECMWRKPFRLVIILLGLVLAIDLIVHLVAEGLWFQEVGYLDAFVLRVETQAILWAMGCGMTAVFLGLSLVLAKRLKYRKEAWTREELEAWKPGNIEDIYAPFPTLSNPLPVTKPLGLGWILFLSLGLGLGIGILLLYYGQVVATLWHPDWRQPEVSPSIPLRLDLLSAGQMLHSIAQQPWQLGFLLAVPIALMAAPQLLAIAIAVLLSLGFGMLLSAHWAKVLQFLSPTAFDGIDPVFKHDLSVYIFRLPIAQLLEFWLFGMAVYALASVSLIYILSGHTLSEGQFPGFSAHQQRHLQALSGVTMLVIGLRYGLRCCDLLYSTTAVNYGASFTDVWARLPANVVLSVLAVAIALMFLRRSLFSPNEKQLFLAVLNLNPGFSQPIPIFYTIGGYFLTALVLGWAIPGLVQRIAVQPNELVREKPYIERSIRLTRAGFNLDEIDLKSFNPTGKLTPAELKDNHLTIDNIRLWDTRPLLDTNRQLQQIRLYYSFNSAHLDRYTLRRTPTPENPMEVEKQQAIVAARELDFSAVPQQAQTWVNQHLVYTHGFGFTLSPVNRAAPSGLPEYFVKGIAPENSETGSPIEAPDANIRASIPLGFPRIYYGELTDNYALTSTNTPEFDYPSGNSNVYNTYAGKGGIRVSRIWGRWLFAEYLRDWRMLWTDFKPSTKILFRRNIADRVRYIAPFLRYDSKPYLVVADANLENPDEFSSSENYLYWILDAYTTSDRYPYSDPGDNSFNYIRNSVKVVVDVYHGTVKFYVADPDEPILQSYQKIFPGFFQPLDQLPTTLRSHIRYPVDIFSVQCERLLTYHMTEPQVFYNREDLWHIPTEIYRDEAQRMEPYYLIMKLPTAQSEEFILLNPFTPPNRSNLIAWMAARSDGNNYGKLLLYQFTKQDLVYGPEQIEARINQQPLISEQFSLWNQQGSRVIKGNLLVIPFEKSLLYVEPIYLEAEQNSLPTLVRVIVAYQDSIVMAPTLQEALDAIFVPEKIPEEKIIRSVEELNPGL